MLLGGVVHQDIELAKAPDDLVDDAPAERVGGEVALEGQALRSDGADEAVRFVASSSSFR